MGDTVNGDVFAEPHENNELGSKEGRQWAKRDCLTVPSLLPRDVLPLMACGCDLRRPLRHEMCESKQELVSYIRAAVIGSQRSLFR